MTRRLTLTFALLLTAACTAERPEGGGLGVRVSTTDEAATLGEQGTGVLKVTGEVTGFGYTPQANVLAGYGEPSQGVTITTEEGEVYALGWALHLGERDLATRPQVKEGEVVTLTVSVEQPWGTYEGVMLEGDFGLVLGGVSGHLSDFGLEQYVVVEEGAVLDGVFEHECGKGRRLELDATADTSVSVATGQSDVLEVGGHPATFHNLTAWKHQEIAGMHCSDWSEPFSWAVQR